MAIRHPFIRDYLFVTKRIELEFKVRRNRGLQSDVEAAWKENGVGESALMPSQARTDASILALLTSPIKALYCTFDWYYENLEREGKYKARRRLYSNWQNN